VWIAEPRQILEAPGERGLDAIVEIGARERRTKAAAHRRQVPLDDRPSCRRVAGEDARDERGVVARAGSAPGEADPGGRRRRDGVDGKRIQAKRIDWLRVH
jgi:hypothetical protein